MKKLFAVIATAFTLGASAMSQSDVHFWVGDDNGANKCVIVIDWYGEAKAWGYQWNKGTATNLLEMVRRVAREDHRLTMKFQPMASYTDLYFFGYDVNDVCPTYTADGFGGSSDPEALVGAEDRQYFSQFWVLYGPMTGSTFPTEPQYSSWYAADQIYPANGDWYVFTIGCPDYDESWNESPAYLAEPTPAESPYGFKVVDSFITTKAANFKDPNNTLGRPTTYMTGAWGGPVTPYNPAWMAKELLTLDGEDNYVTIEFDHDVMDDDNNPYGIDLLVFGNSLIVGKSTDYYGERDSPEAWVYTGKIAAEPADVLVSQDGKTWYSYSEPVYCDDWAPTQGLVYDEKNPWTELYSGNKWWGLPTDACKPVDPSKTANDSANLTIKELALRFNGSAGGAGFDLKKFPGLPATKNGKRWIRYVKIMSHYDEEEGEWTSAEVDAVADVAPTSEYDLWVINNYDWDVAYKAEVSGKEVVSPNGLPNVVNQFLGYTGTQVSKAPVKGDPGTKTLDDGTVVMECNFSIAGFTPGELYHDIVVKSNQKISGNSGLIVKQSEDLTGWVGEVPNLVESIYDESDGLIHNTFRVSNQGKFLRLSIGE